jgi:spore maturation protein CgeB
VKILFIGDSWSGSSARALREGLRRQQDVVLDDIGQDLVVPLYSYHPLRGISRLLSPLQVTELKRQIRLACEDFSPDVVMIYKGVLDSAFISEIKTKYAPVVNIFPDASPHLYGDEFKAAMGEYDLVISAKGHHPPLWSSLYGYSNRCVHVAQGYDPQVHLRHEPVREARYDVVLVATWRAEYEALLKELTRLARRSLSIAVAGGGWPQRNLNIPGVDISGPKHGAAYVEWLRRGRIVLAPVMQVVAVDGPTQPGDQITDRTFQCAAAYTFFIHRRTPEALERYDEATEAPMYDDAQELVDQIETYLQDPKARRRFAAAAHRRAVPAYSIDARAAEMMDHLSALVAERAMQSGKPEPKGSGKAL